MQATNQLGTTEVTRTITLDTQRPTGTLVDPAPGTVNRQDSGFVDMQWTDAGAAGIDPASFGVADISISGITVDRAENLGNGRVRYHYNDDGDTLPSGTIEITVAADAVFDQAANTNEPQTFSFSTDQQSPEATLRAPASASFTKLDTGYVDIQWTDSGTAGLVPSSLDATDVTVTGVSVDRIEVLGSGRVRYWYDDDGEQLVDGVIQVVTQAGGVLDLAGNAARTQSFSFAFDTHPPQARFVAPTTNALFETDLGYFEVQWADAPAGVDQQSLDAGDIKIQGVTVDRVEMLASGNVRYWYNDDGDKLRLGTIVVTVQSNQVADQTSNFIEGSIVSLRRLRLACPWNNLLEQYDSNFDGSVTPHDALVTINQLNDPTLIDEAGRFATPGVADLVPSPFYDVNCDNFVTSQDVLVVFNELNRRTAASEGEPVIDSVMLDLSLGAVVGRSQLVLPESEQLGRAFHDTYFSAQASERPAALKSATRSSDSPTSAASGPTRANAGRTSSARATYRARNVLSHENIEDLLPELTAARTAQWHDHDSHDTVFDDWR